MINRTHVYMVCVIVIDYVTSLNGVGGTRTCDLLPQDMSVHCQIISSLRNVVLQYLWEKVSRQKNM